MRTASLGLPALINSASASSNLPFMERKEATHDENKVGITDSKKQGFVTGQQWAKGGTQGSNHTHTSSSRYIAYLR